jgi:hypothetical protein
MLKILLVSLTLVLPNLALAVDQYAIMGGNEVLSCSQPCGGGVQGFPFFCTRNDGVRVDMKNCDDQNPSNKELYKDTLKIRDSNNFEIFIQLRSCNIQKCE